MSEYVSEAVDPLPSSEPVVIEEAPVEEAVVAPSTEEVVQEVSTSDNVDNSKVNELEERVKVLEERLEKLVDVLMNKSNNQSVTWINHMKNV